MTNKCLATKNRHDKIIEMTKENCRVNCDYFTECYSAKKELKTCLP